MAGSTIDARGRTTVPAEIRAVMGARTGTRLIRSVRPDGAVIVRAKPLSVHDSAGVLTAPQGEPVSVGDIQPWR